MYSQDRQELKDFIHALALQAPEIEAIYFFGSRVNKNRPSEKSDIDIAFLFDKTFYGNYPLKAFFACQMIGAEISEYYAEPVDVSLLNNASLCFTYEVITTGLCLYEKDHTGRILYEIAVKGQFFDFKPFLVQLREKKLKTLSSIA